MPTTPRECLTPRSASPPMTSEVTTMTCQRSTTCLWFPLKHLGDTMSSNTVSTSALILSYLILSYLILLILHYICLLLSSLLSSPILLFYFLSSPLSSSLRLFSLISSHSPLSPHSLTSSYLITYPLFSNFSPHRALFFVCCFISQAR